MSETGYDSRGPLAARLSLYDWQTDRVDLPGEAIDLLTGVTGTVLDVGCGLGQYVDRLGAERPDLRIVGLDVSPTMARHIRADATALPVADDACGAALAMHMLYHVEDRARAVLELRRVVRSGGIALTSTNGATDKTELYDVISRASGKVFVDPARAFTLDDAAVLEAVFDEVVLHRYVRTTVVPVTAPLVAFVASVGVTAPVVDRAELLFAEAIAECGAFILTNEIGIFACR